MLSPTYQKVMGRLKPVLVGGLLLCSSPAFAQIDPDTSASPDALTVAAPTSGQAPKLKWTEKISIRGYVQVRYNRLLESNPNLKTDYDKSVGDNGGFLIRRARLVFSGQVHDRVFIYIQPDLATTPSGSSSIHFAQIRDAYADISVDEQDEFRFRIGQSKIPYGFENLQSSSNRLALDRADALNSGMPNERDLGLLFYWAPEHIRDRFKQVGNRTLKGSGDYGVFGLGVYNGQTVNRNEANDNLHVVARLSYPIALKNGQIVEPGLQGYTGTYTVTPDQLSAGMRGGNFDDRRAAASVVWYPQPLGFQAEYNVGEGPQFDPETRTIRVKSLHGGYAQAMYQLRLKNQLLMPFAKVQYYKGGKKNETDAGYSEVYETEIGVEWQPISAFELVAQYTITDRTTQDGSDFYNYQFGSLLRLQAQFNF